MIFLFLGEPEQNQPNQFTFTMSGNYFFGTFEELCNGGGNDSYEITRCVYVKCYKCLKYQISSHFPGNRT